MTVEELARCLGVGAWRILRYLDRRSGYTVTIHLEDTLSDADIDVVTRHFTQDPVPVNPVVYQPLQTASRSVPFVCPDCGHSTRAGRRHGNLYSHNIPGVTPTKVCPRSGDIVRKPEPENGAPAAPPLVPPRPHGPKPPDLAPVYYDSLKRSPREISGGLPGMGRRHR